MFPAGVVSRYDEGPIPFTGSFQNRHTPGSSSSQWQGNSACACSRVQNRQPCCGTTWRASRHIGQDGGAAKWRCQEPQLSHRKAGQARARRRRGGSRGSCGGPQGRTGRKQFFFEKKNQKNLLPKDMGRGARQPPQRRTRRAKFFASFFQKRSASFTDPSTAARFAGSSHTPPPCPPCRAAGSRRRRWRPGAAAGCPGRSAASPR